MLWFAVSAVNKNAPIPNATNPNRGRVPTARIKDQYKDLAQPSPLNSTLLLLMRSPVNRRACLRSWGVLTSVNSQPDFEKYIKFPGLFHVSFVIT